MEFFDVVDQRHSIRAYTTEPVGPDALNRILDAMLKAPSAGNRQAYQVSVVTDPRLKHELVVAAGDQEFIAQAPVVLVFCTHPALSAERYGERGVRLYSLQDATIACTFAMLAAAALGLATVWVGAFDEEQVRQVIDAPVDQMPVAILPIGHPDGPPRLRPRRPLEEVVRQSGTEQPGARSSQAG